jgi:hypothetical protein
MPSDAAVRAFGIGPGDEVGWRVVSAFEESERELVLRPCIDHAIVDGPPRRDHHYKVEPFANGMKGEDRRVAAVTLTVDVEVALARYFDGELVIARGSEDNDQFKWRWVYLGYKRYHALYISHNHDKNVKFSTTINSYNPRLVAEYVPAIRAAEGGNPVKSRG